MACMAARPRPLPCWRASDGEPSEPPGGAVSAVGVEDVEADEALVVFDADEGVGWSASDEVEDHGQGFEEPLGVVEVEGLEGVEPGMRDATVVEGRVAPGD